METVGTTVGSKTKSLLQSLKDKTEQLKTKRSEYVEPADVTENKVCKEISTQNAMEHVILQLLLMIWL